MKDRKRERERRTQVIVGRLQSRTTPPQDVHLEDWLRLDIHREGGDGPLVDALGHAVVQTLDQLLHLFVELRQALAILWLPGGRKVDLVRTRSGRKNSDSESVCRKEK